MQNLTKKFLLARLYWYYNNSKICWYWNSGRSSCYRKWSDKSTGQTASLSFDVPPWAISSRVNFTNLTTGLGQPGFRIRVNGQSTNYDGATMIHFPYASNQPYYSERIEWADAATAGCFVGVSSYLTHNNEFGRMMYASGYINLSMLDPA